MTTRNPLTASTRIVQALTLQPMTSRALSEVLTLHPPYVDVVLRQLKERNQVQPVGVQNKGWRKGSSFLWGVRT